MNEDKILQDLGRIESETIDAACKLLSKYEEHTETYLAKIVASICGVNVDEMLSDTTITRLAQPRWLYWYAIRYMSNETYDKIAERTEQKGGSRFTPNGIGQSINKMSAMIASEPIWQKRWTIVKRVIKLRNATKNEDDVVTIRVIAPKDIKLNIKTE